jgi:hypothetical protein
VREVELNRRQAQDEAEAPTVKARDQVLATGEAQLALLRDQVEKRETKTTQMETALRERMTEIEQSEQELRLQEARLGADLELREEKLVQLAEELEERESRLADREQDLAAYVGELQRTVA